MKDADACSNLKVWRRLQPVQVSKNFICETLGSKQDFIIFEVKNDIFIFVAKNGSRKTDMFCVQNLILQRCLCLSNILNFLRCRQVLSCTLFALSLFWTVFFECQYLVSLLELWFYKIVGLSEDSLVLDHVSVLYWMTFLCKCLQVWPP